MNGASLVHQLFSCYNNVVMEFAVKQDSFSGPLGLLLNLLDKQELEIKNVNLAKIADDYLAFMDSQTVPAQETADFLLIASRLIYLKSKELMPYLRIEEEEVAVSLEDQLRLYRLFSDAAEKIEDLYGGDRTIFMRTKPRIRTKQTPAFLPPTGATPDMLRQSFGWILKRLAPFFALQQASIERIKSVEERLEELKGAVTSRASMKFKEVIRGAKSKGEVVVSFLALLELVRRSVVKVTQAKGSDIHIQKV
jgi:segregation and condensation protein A